MPGMRTSTNTRSGRAVRTRRIASSPVDAMSGVCPSASSSRPNASQMELSSSATRTRAMVSVVHDRQRKELGITETP